MREFTKTKTKTYVPVWVNRDAFSYTEDFQRIRRDCRLKMSSCFKCDHRFKLDEKLVLVRLEGVGNRMFCETCADWIDFKPLQVMPRVDELERMVVRLEELAPMAKGCLCGNRSCLFYIEVLLSSVKKQTGRVPAHSCIGILGPYGGGDFAKALKAARAKYAEKLRRENPELFEEM